MRCIGVVSEEHVGQVSSKLSGISVWWPDVMGKVLPQDIGKRVYAGLDIGSMNTVISVESTEQRNRRLSQTST